ncbi:MAG: hypothetical protein M0Z39_07145 [Actinomycetota bacterium]|nr:hypothetical protein [Actinomycetota bacterium]
MNPNAVALLPVLLTLLGFLVFCLVDLIRAKEVRYLPNCALALIYLVSVPLGGIVYLLAGGARPAGPTPDHGPSDRYEGLESGCNIEP